MNTQDPNTQGELEEALADRPRRSGIPTSTGVLAAIVLLAAGSLGGLLVGRHTATNQAGPAAEGFPGGFPSPGASGAPGGGFGNGFTVGTVTRVDGDTVYLKTSDGSTVKVATDSNTQIRVSMEGSVQDLSAGSTVVVQGSKNGQGGFRATSITEGGVGLGEPTGGMGGGANFGG